MKRIRASLVPIMIGVGLLGGALLLLMLPGGASFNAVEGSAQLSFTVDRTRIALADNCIFAQWSVEGIRAVYINDESTTGNDSRTLCGIDSATLRVIKLDDSEWVQTAYIFPLLHNRYFLLGVVVGVITLMTGILMRLPAPNWTHFLETTRTHVLSAMARPVLVIGAITVLGAMIRIVFVDHYSLWYDENVLYRIANVSDFSQLIENNAIGNSAPPLFAIMLNWVINIFGVSETSLRGIALVSSILAIPAFYVLARQYVGRNIAYAITFLLAVAASQIRYAMEVREYGLTVLLTILILYTYIRFMRAPQLLNAAALIIVWCVGMFTQYGLAVFILVLNLSFLIEWLQNPVRFKRLIGWGFMQAFVAAAAWVVVDTTLRTQFSVVGFGSSYLGHAYGDDTLGSLFNLVTLRTYELFQFAFPSDIFILLIAAGVIAVILNDQHNRKQWLPLVLSFPITIVLAFLQFFPYHGGRQDFFLTIPLFLLSGVGIEAVLRAVYAPRTRLLIIGMSAVLMVSGVYGVYNMLMREIEPQNRQAYEYVRDRWEESDVIYLHGISVDGYTIYERAGYFDNLPPAVVGGSPADPDAFLREIPALLENPNRIWVVATDCLGACRYQTFGLFAGQRETRTVFEAARATVFLVDPLAPNDAPTG